MELVVRVHRVWNEVVCHDPGMADGMVSVKNFVSGNITSTPSIPTGLGVDLIANFFNLI